MREFTEIHVLIYDDNPAYRRRFFDAVDRVNEEIKHQYIKIVPKAPITEDHFIVYIQDQIYDYVILDLCHNVGNDESLTAFQRIRNSINQAYHGVELYSYVQKFSPESNVIAISNMPVSYIRHEFQSSDIYGIKAYFNKKETDEYTLVNYLVNNFETGGRRFVNNIFVVYGHNREMRLSVERCIKRWHINVIELDRDGPGGMQTVFSKLYESSKKADCAVVLMSGDDQTIDANGKTTFRARQNVIFEAGIFVGRLGPEKVIILKEDTQDFEWPSDLSGMHPIIFDSKGQWKEKLKRHLDMVGFELSH